ncbi:MAG: hypothetical protein IJ246_01385 [Clostridia bacterium]|nr:hypothetical protein [Clostridia bacterium]
MGERLVRVSEQWIGDTRLEIVEDTETHRQYVLSGTQLTPLGTEGTLEQKPPAPEEALHHRTVCRYVTEVIDYSPKAKDMARLIEDKCNEMGTKGQRLVSMSVMPSAKAILVFESLSGE